jgi:hypothetical protein
MKRALNTVFVAAVAAAASWAVSVMLRERRNAKRRVARKPLESWENEGGALAPQHVAVETSQVPR